MNECDLYVYQTVPPLSYEIIKIVYNGAYDNAIEDKGFELIPIMPATPPPAPPQNNNNQNPPVKPS